MKKGLYIALFLFGLLAVSCDKQEIVPNVDRSMDAPEWVSPYEKGGGSGTDGGVDDGSDDSGITDPNDDPDGNSGKKP